MEITDFEGNCTTFKITVPANSLPTSAKDVPCLVKPPEHNWYKVGIFMKCSKCGMAYEKPADKDFKFNLTDKH